MLNASELIIKNILVECFHGANENVVDAATRIVATIKNPMYAKSSVATKENKNLF